MLDVDKAAKEQREKEVIGVEMEPAKTWGGRAAASYRLSQHASKLGERVRRLYEGENFRQEALEHAAMTEDPDFLHVVGDEIQEARKEALEVIQELLSETEVTNEPPRGERKPAQFGRRHAQGRARRERYGIPTRPAQVRRAPNR